MPAVSTKSPNDFLIQKDAVSTINFNDFLVQKDSGDVVTGEDWNKLVALFYAVNLNAEALLTTIKNVDINTANIAQVTQGAVPNNSIGYDKLEKKGGIKSVYAFTEDVTPKAGVTYYTVEDGVYRPHENLTSFTSGVQYYELQQVATEPAIADAAVINDHIIAPHHCIESFLGALLNDTAVVYTNKAVRDRFSETILSVTESAPTATHTITFEKQHKAFIILGTNTITLLYASEDKPDIYVGSNYRDASTFTYDNDGSEYYGLSINTLVGADKKNRPPQSITSLANADSPGAPYPLAGSDRAVLQQCYYDYASKSINLTFKNCRREALNNYGTSVGSGQTVVSYKYHATEYSFGNLIIGL